MGGQYVELPGVKTWYEVEGAGDPVVLLHGGFCPNETWEPQRAALAASYKIFLPERRAHGRTPDVDGPLSYRDMAKDTIDFIESVVGGSAHLIGWSDGGIVALIVAGARPDLVKKLVVVSANFRPAPEVAVAPEMLEHLSADAPEMGMLRSMYEAAAPDGPDHWTVVVEKMAAMYRTEPDLSEADLARIGTPTLVLASDDDQMTLEHTVALFRGLSDAELAIVPGTSHGLLMEKPALANGLILDFLADEKPPTMMPILRAGAPAGA